MRASLTALRRAVPGVASTQYFDTLRRGILSDLETNSNDKSLAGRVDPQIEGLVNFVNQNFKQYVTSSSCGGRVSLFHRAKASKSGDVVAPEGASNERKRGGFGKGTLFQSHDPLPDVEGTVTNVLQPCLREWWTWRSQQKTDAVVHDSEVLQLKFEPMIIHILCADISSAAALLQCGSESGQMQSGIVSCSRGTAEHRKITCCLTSPLMVDIPLYTGEQWILPPQSASSATSSEAAAALFADPAWTSLLTHTLSHINRLFAENEHRKERLLTEMKRRLVETPIALPQ